MMKKLKIILLFTIVYPLVTHGQPVVFTPGTTDSTVVAHLFQGLRYMNGVDSLPKDYKEAVKFLKMAADQGEYTAQFFIALIYEKGGYGIQQNIQKAFHWYEKCAQNGFAEGMVYYGRLIIKNEGNQANYKKGVALFRDAAEQGNLKGIYALGYMYFKGFGIEQDYSNAFQLFQSAASQQHVSSIHMLGYCYEFGFGTEQSLENAIYCYEFAASKGYEQSIVRLAELKEAGLKSVSISSNFLHQEFENQQLIPRTCTIIPDLKHSADKDFAGEWEGVFYTYDWSGRQIIDQQKVILTLSKNQTHFHVNLDADYTHTSGEIYFNEQDAYFENIELKIKDSFGEFVDQTFNNMNFKVTINEKGTYLTGKVESYLEKHQEPGAPSILILKLKSAVLPEKESFINQAFDDIHLTVYPNPFHNTLNVRFSLTATQTVSINLYDMNGKLVKSIFDLKSLEAGEHKMAFNEELPQGIYLLDFCFNKEHHVQRIIKN